jgi:hypothetical protein
MATAAADTSISRLEARSSIGDSFPTMLPYQMRRATPLPCQLDRFAANERILAPLEPQGRELWRDLLVRVIQGNAAYARPGAGRRKRRVRKAIASNQAGGRSHAADKM